MIKGRATKNTLAAIKGTIDPRPSRRTAGFFFEGLYFKEEVYTPFS
jgi:hypothetical protein